MFSTCSIFLATRGRHAQTQRLIDRATEMLKASHPMTVRQVYYRLVSSQVIKNSRSQYQAVSNALVAARKEGAIPWAWIEDRLRRPRAVSMWRDIPAFAQTTLAAYRRDIWPTQAGYVEVWLEKDALSGIFEDVLNSFGVTLNVGRGYDGWDSVRNAAVRFADGRNGTILYYGDFDPSGEDMVRSLRDRLAFFGCRPTLLKCALVQDDIARYELPPDFTKATDTRRAGFVATYGDVALN